MLKLLTGNPEQEKNLLTYIVNKIGDPSQKIASKAIYSLGQLLFKHPNMQAVVLNEVEKLLFRSNISTKAQYYSLCFLSQFYLSHDSNEVARRLIEVYFAFFKSCIKKGEVDSRMMSALLMGVNRAYPYAKLELEKISDHIDTIYRVVHVANFNISLHALSLLYQVSVHENTVSDRFYSALYKKLIDPKLLTTTHQAMLLSLIFKAILKDTEIVRIKVFVKRLLQLALFMQPSFACGVLYLISQLIGKRTNIQSLVLKQSVLKDLDDDNDEEERYYDVQNDETDTKQDDDNDENRDLKTNTNTVNESALQPSWDHSANARNNKNNRRRHPCNFLSRNPLYAGGEFCAYNELIYLKHHFHPTVALYATNILDGNIIKYSGDPLKDFTLIRFLDRFVFKNPKKNEDKFVQGAHPTFGKRKMYQPKGLKLLPINSPSYLNEKFNNIPIDEQFMYTYLQRKYKEKNMKTEDEDSDLESVQSDEFEEILDKMAGIPKENEDLDYLNEIGDTLKVKEKDKKRRNQVNDDDNESDFEDPSGENMSIEDEDFDDNLDEEDDLEMNDDDKMLLEDLDDDDEEEIVFDEEDKRKLKKMKSDDVTSIFAAAEEFASLLDDEGASKIAPGGSNQFSNKDNANIKQIAWEDKRNRWLKGYNKAIGKGRIKNDNFGKKRTDQNKFQKKKKIKKGKQLKI
jgi:ribosome biogenesis protein MAK21